MAKIAVNYSTKIKKGDRVLIFGSTIAEDLVLAIIIETIKAGGHPFTNVNVEGEQEAKLKYGSDEQLEYVDDIIIQAAKEFDALISVRAEYNTRKFSGFDQSKVAKATGNENQRKLNEIIQKRSAQGEFNWVILPYPCEAYAQEANMDILSYTDFMKKSLFLDKDDPVGEWKNLDEKQQKIVDYLDQVKKIHVLGEDTDLTLSVEDRPWKNCSGDHNLPDGEVFTSPVEDSVNGSIRFTYPGIYYGQEVVNVYLEFEDGEVTKATAEKGQPILDEILKIDGAKRLGEFAIGNNYGVKDFTKNILFDEKLGGTIHCALGFGPKETGSENESAIHWDILKDMTKEGSKIIADGEVIYEEGKWKMDKIE